MKKLFWQFDWIILTILSFSTRLIPFFLYSSHPLGYDMGFYRRYAAQPFSSFPNTITTGLAQTDLFPRLLLDTLRTFISNPNIVIYGGLIISFTFSVLGFRFFLKKHLGQKAGFVGGLLFLFSGVQYVGYWFFLLKNYLALGGLLFSFAFLKDFEDKKKFSSQILFILSFLFVLLSQTTTSIVGLITFFLYFFSKNFRNLKKVFLSLAYFALCVSVVFIFHPTLFTKVISWQPTAIFLEWPDYFSLAFPSIALLLFSFIYFRKNFSYQFSLPLVLLLVSSVFPVFHLPFYQRIFLFLDIAVLFYNVKLLFFFTKNYSFFSQRSRIIAIVISASFLGLFIGKFFSTVIMYQPFITMSEVQEMKKIDLLTEKEANILTTSDYMPSVYGFSQRKVFAPGLLEYNYNLSDWEKFWYEMNEQEKIKFLSLFPKPLYFFSDSQGDENFLTADCVIKKTHYISEFVCK